MRNLFDTSAHDQRWKSNPRPFDLSPMSYPLGHMLLQFIHVMSSLKCHIHVVFLCLSQMHSYVKFMNINDLPAKCLEAK